MSRYLHKLPAELEIRLLLTLPPFNAFRDEVEEQASKKLCKGLMQEACEILTRTEGVFRKEKNPPFHACTCAHCQWCRAAVNVVHEQITESRLMAYKIISTLLEEQDEKFYSVAQHKAGG